MCITVTHKKGKKKIKQTPKILGVEQDLWKKKKKEEIQEFQNVGSMGGKV